jgi:hypothetical protein
LKEDARDLAALKELKELVDEAYAAKYAAVKAGMFAAEEFTGTQKISAALPDGAKVGTVSITGGDKVAVVTDEKALLEWAVVHAPTEVERREVTVTQIRPAYVKRILAEATSTQAPEIDVVDEATWEIVKRRVPGVEIRTQAKGIRYTRVKGAHELITQAWQRGVLPLPVPGLPQLAPPPAEDGAT